MSESIINALVQLFAIIESGKDAQDVDSGELIVKPYLKGILNEELTREYLALFNDYLLFYRNEDFSNENDIGDLSIHPTTMLQVAKICNQLNNELLKHDRIFVFLQLLELINADNKVSAKENEFINLVALNFNLDSGEVKNIRAFMLDKDTKGIDKKFGLLIDSRMTEWPKEVAVMMRKRHAKVPGTTDFRHMFVKNLFGKIFVLYIPSVEMFVFKYNGPLNIYLEGNKIQKNRAYLLKPGSIIKGPNIRSIYESEITHQFLDEKTKYKSVLIGENLEFHFKNSKNGIQKFNFAETSGQLIGIMGGSGVGKSTLINLLNGKIKPTNGKVHLNGHPIDIAAKKGVIGYVPQDDMLFEELSVYQNLYYNAKVSFSDFSEERLERKVNEIVETFDLMEIIHLKVGDPLNKSISGGQRKRLNIALELMREPTILFVDEPTSGLSSNDSEKVMWLLKEMTRKGKLVFAIIHQPYSDIFKLFDKLWILDKGGYPIYSGNPVDAVVYFKTMRTQVNAAESECPHCGNVVLEIILQIIEAKEIDEKGNYKKERRVSPQEWYEKYKENIESQLAKPYYEEILPPSNFNIPSPFHQFRIFSKRNFLSKLANRQYIIINLLEAALLALILSFLSKYSSGEVYTFSDNKNIPVFLFMAVVVALFLGMSVSAEEIFKDRKILERESFLNLSKLSYINSKIFYLFCLSAFQSLCFVLIGNYILEIKGMFFHYWLILFSTSCAANLIGLNISASLNSIITIYILIPFILVPQLLLGGALIRFDDLHKNFTNKIHVPLIGDLMISRWSYEALAVVQFKRNEYQKHFFDVEKDISQASYLSAYLIPYLKSSLRKIGNDSENSGGRLNAIKKGFEDISNYFGSDPYPITEFFEVNRFNADVTDRAINFLENKRVIIQRNFQEFVDKKDQRYESLLATYSPETIKAIRVDYHNKSLEDMVLNKNRVDKIYETKKRIVQKKDPIYMEPDHPLGRAHFYAPVKKVGSVKVDTLWFNIIVIWLITGLFYLTLYYDFFKRLVRFFTYKKRKD